MKCLLSFLFFIWSSWTFGQHSFTIKAVIVDSILGETIPFATIYNSSQQTGTLSDFNGAFILDQVQPNDTITFSFIGYEKAVLLANPTTSYDTIYLNPETQLIDEVIVFANNPFLYELLAKARKTQQNQEERSKAYFELESFHADKQLELFQGYYNGSFVGYNVAKLEMKNGRFALAPLSKRIFASTESSKALCMHNMMQANTFFPKSPFEFNKQKLIKHYKLSLHAKYINEAKRSVYLIQFEPRKEKEAYFSGMVWIDSLSNAILKTELTISNAQVHPFSAIWSTHTLDTVNLEITKSYSLEDSKVRLNTVHFNYDLVYKSLQDSALDISTRAVLYAYNYDEVFTLPFFAFPNTSNADYRRIQLLPSDSLFWLCSNEFKLENNAAKNAFIQNEATINAHDLFRTDTIFEKNFFENPFVSWNGNRILLKGLSADSSNYYDARGTIAKDRYHLKVQLFVDVNEVCDSVQVITKTIFDPYESFYHFETTKESQVFLNIYFDLMEIERRKLALALESVKYDRELIREVYQNAVKRADQISNVYFKEVQRGANKEALLKWNNYVLQELHIDNIKLFALEMK